MELNRKQNFAFNANFDKILLIAENCKSFCHRKILFLDYYSLAS